MPFTLEDHVLVQAIFSRTSEAPVMNTFMFSHGGASFDRDQVRADIVDALDDFYVATTGQTSGIRSRMSSLLLTLKYRFGFTNDPPNTPFDEEPSLAWTTPPSALRLPPQLAVCASYRAAPPNTARRRGRIYIGPLASEAHNTANGAVEATFRADIGTASKRLADIEYGISEIDWVIASRKFNESARIVHGYVDGDFDSQDRRSVLSQLASRTTWDAADA